MATVVLCLIGLNMPSTLKPHWGMFGARVVYIYTKHQGSSCPVRQDQQPTAATSDI